MYCIIQFPDLDTALPFYLKGKELFSTRCSCMNRDPDNPIVAFMLYVSDIPKDSYRLFKETLPPNAVWVEVDVQK